MTARAPSFYVTGGTLPPDAPCYVERRADGELLDCLQRGEFCYVLTSRQMGKSSLMLRTADRLRRSGHRVVVLDLTALGYNLDPDESRSVAGSPGWTALSAIRPQAPLP